MNRLDQAHVIELAQANKLDHQDEPDSDVRGEWRVKDDEELKQLIISAAAQHLVKRCGRWQLVAQDRPRARAMSAPSSSTRRTVKPNSAYPPQAAVKMTNDRRQPSPSGGAPASPSTTPKAPVGETNQSATPPAPADENRSQEAADLAKRVEALENRWQEEKGALERRVSELEAENKVMKGELQGMRDKMEEGVWARKRLEDRVKEQEEEVKRELEKVKKDRKDWDEKVAKEISEIKRGVADLVGRETVGPRPSEDTRQRDLIFADSNGHETTEEEVKDHIVREERDRYDVKIIPAYHVEDVYKMVANHQVDVNGAILVIDCLTNDVRGTKRKSAIGPEELIRQVDILRSKTWGAKETVLCQVKPMRHIDVTRHNALLHEYLCVQGSVGCQTMIRTEYLKVDGFHVLPQFKSVLHRQFACALLGVPVPCPTPYEDFVSGNLGRQYDQEWPTLRFEGSNAHYGR